MSKKLTIFREFLEEMIIPQSTIDFLMDFTKNTELLIKSENAFIDPFLRRELKTLIITANKEQIDLIVQALSETLKVKTKIISFKDNLQAIIEKIQKLNSMDTSSFIDNKINLLLVITNIDEAFSEEGSIEALKKQEKYLDLLNLWKNKFSSTISIIGVIKSPFLLKDEIEWWSRKIFIEPTSIHALSQILEEKGLPFQFKDINDILETAEGINQKDFVEIIEMAWNMEFSSLKSFISYLEDYPKDYSISQIRNIEKLLN